MHKYTEVHDNCNPLSPDGSFIAQKMAITSPIPVFWGLIKSYSFH